METECLTVLQYTQMVVKGWSIASLSLRIAFRLGRIYGGNIMSLNVR